MKDLSLKQEHLVLISILSVVRIVLYFYWYYWISNFIIPVIFITPIGYFFLIQLPIIQIILDLCFIIGFLLTKGKTWILFSVSSIVAFFHMLYLSMDILSVPGILGILILTVSGLQILMIIVLNTR